MNNLVLAVATEDNNLSTRWVEQFLQDIFSQDFWLGLADKALQVFIVVVIAFVMTKIFKYLIKKIFKLRNNSRFSNQRTVTLMKLVENVALYVMYFLIISTALEFIGIPVTGLLAGAGIFGLAIGFGAQNLVKDIITGFFIILEDQIAVGDYVNIDPRFEGTVEEIGLRTTKIKGFTGEVHIIPNGSIPSVTNFSRHNSVAVVDIGIAADNDLKYAESVIKELLLEMTSKYPELQGEPKLLGVETFGQNEVVFRVTAEVEPMTHFKISRDLRREIKIRLDQKGIKIPYPQMVVVDPEREGEGGEE